MVFLFYAEKSPKLKPLTKISVLSFRQKPCVKNVLVTTNRTETLLNETPNSIANISKKELESNASPTRR